MSKLGEKQRTSLRTSEIALHFFIRNRRLIVGPNLVYSYTLPKFDDLHWYPQPCSQGGYGRGYTMGIYWAIPAVGDTFMFLDLAWRLHYRLYENMDCVSGYTDRNSRCASLDMQ